MDSSFQFPDFPHNSRPFWTFIENQIIASTIYITRPELWSRDTDVIIIFSIKSIKMKNY